MAGQLHLDQSVPNIGAGLSVWSERDALPGIVVIELTLYGLSKLKGCLVGTRSVDLFGSISAYGGERGTSDGTRESAIEGYHGAVLLHAPGRTCTESGR